MPRLLALLLACAPAAPPAEPAAGPAAEPAAEPAVEPAVEPAAEPAAAPAVATATAPVVVLISWDTTRADALSPYAAELPWRPGQPGAPQPRTPVAQALADGGVRFAWALAHAPTTLSSHTTMMSGLDPHGHRVVRNGYPVPADVPLLAERFAAAGWDTLAVLGASVLEQRMGLARGFRVYDDQVELRVRKRYEDRADRVTARALAAVDQRRKDRPLLLFVHYFDAHSPWDSAPDALQAGFVDHLDRAVEEPGPLITRLRQGPLPVEDSHRARGMYLAEVAWVDQQTGALLDGLRQRGLLEQALVVLVGDHGETLDEPGIAPYGHGPDADLPALHVPLILHGTGAFALPAGVVVPDTVGLVDLAPTVLALAGLDPAFGAGRDLAPTWAAPGTLPAPPRFAEATKPDAVERHDAWNNLPFDRAVAAEGHLLRATPFLHRGPTLTRLAAGQPLVTDQPDLARRLARLLADWDAAAPPHRDVDMDPETTEALRALGYLE